MISQVLQKAIEQWASDIIISPGNFPALKKSGEIIYLEDFGKVSGDDLKEEIFTIIPEKLKQEFINEMEVDFSVQADWLGRFRVNGFKQKWGYGLVFRIIANSIPEFEELKIPEAIRSFSDRKSGLVLITGWVWSGKSTTLASLINEINKHHKKHIITIEDPIEFVHESNTSLIEQREVGSTTHSFENGLKYALRQASDVIMIWEMRDLETFRLALRAAETWNLVFATLHTSGAARTISRIIDMFPWEEKWYIRTQVSESLLWVVWQDLVKKKDWSRIVATEVLIKNKAIENMIRENQLHQINGAIETGKADGMIPMKRYLDSLLESKEITQDIHTKYMLRYGLIEKPQD
jgi:twitching motility protein PilT